MSIRASGAGIVASLYLSACGGDAGTSPGEQLSLAFIVQPSRAPTGTSLNPPPQVEVHAFSGELNTSSGVAVTVTLVPATGGVLTYWLIASAPGAISTAESGSFRVFAPYHRIAAGAGHSCAARVPGPTYCWGDNGEGQLGLANEPTGSGFVLPQEVTGSSDLGFTALAAGGYHTCGLTASGAVYCWGYNIFHQVGDGTAVSRRGPTLVHTPSGISFSALSAGYWHTCGVTAAGAAYCWGSNSEGALGDGTTTTPSEPVAVTVPPGVTFSSVSAGGEPLRRAWRRHHHRQ